VRANEAGSISEKAFLSVLSRSSKIYCGLKFIHPKYVNTCFRGIKLIPLKECFSFCCEQVKGKKFMG